VPTNEEYFERWENSAPVAVEELSPEQVERAKNRKSDDNPWESFEDEIMGEFSDPDLQAAIEEYASRVSDAAPTAQSDEELCRLTENNERAARDYQWIAPEEYAKEGDRVGRVMGPAMFIRTLQKAGVRCWYRRHPDLNKLTLIVFRNGHAEPEVGCWVFFGYMPELSMFHFDEHGIPLNEKRRGWRTALLQLILKSAISEEKAIECFGRVPTTPAFHRYNSTLQQWRNQGRRLGK
jgi:hypothetical protein